MKHLTKNGCIRLWGILSWTIMILGVEWSLLTAILRIFVPVLERDFVILLTISLVGFTSLVFFKSKNGKWLPKTGLSDNRKGDNQ